MTNVRLENIARQIGNTTIINDITFNVPKGEFWVLVGPSGCGKSTILRTIAGLEAATSGNIYIGDTLVNKIPARDRDVAMVFQNYALYPHMSVAENLAFGLKMRKVNPIEIGERVETVARSLNIDRLLDRKPKQLSGGQQQRVALGRAIAREPQVFLLDEPLSNLDAQLRDDTRSELKQMHSNLKITTIYVTHDRVEAMTLADRIIVLDRGQIQQIGTPQVIYRQPANRMVATFMGSPPMNILPATYMGNFIVSGQSLPSHPEFRDKYRPREGQGFDIGIRPEDISINLDSSADNAVNLVLEIYLIEPLGRETLIRGILPDSEIVVSLIYNGNWQGRVGDRLSIAFDLAHTFIFDPATGERLYPQITEHSPQI
jgi:multiple sugar transport system ATP-binding protein